MCLFESRGKLAASTEDKITTIPKRKLGSRIGHLDAADMARVNQAMLIFLGLAG